MIFYSQFLMKVRLSYFYFINLFPLIIYFYFEKTCLTFFLPMTFTQQAIILAGGILVLAAECLNTAIERIVDDISNKKRPAAEHAKDAGSAAVAVTAIATGVVWIVTIFDLISF